MNKLRSRTFRAVLGAILASSLIPSLGLAQTTPEPPAAEPDSTVRLDRYVVTGSNIPMAADEPALPISVVNRMNIETLGVQTTSDLLQMLPQVVGSGNYRGEQVSNPGGGEATVALRGLPASSTLVLVNGRRVALTSAISLSNSAVNINTIPLAAVERVEILREGAGPVYGSDAIAGVVNIILRDHYRGALLTTEYGNTTEKDAGTVITSLLIGASNDRTDLVVSGSFFDSNAVYSRDRDIVKTADYRDFGAERGGSDWRSSAAPRARIFVNEETDPDGLGLVFGGAEGGTPGSAGDYRGFTSADRYNFREVTNEVLPQTRYGFTLSARHKITDTLRLIGEAGYTKIKSFAEAAPTPLFSDGEPFEDLAGNIVQMTIPVNNRFNPFGAGSSDGLYAADAVYKRFLELGPRSTTTDVHNVRALIALEGTFDKWTWQAGALFSRDATTNFNANLINKRELYNQLQNSDPNVPSINVFGDWTYNLRPEQLPALERIRLNAVNDSSYELTQFDFKINGEAFELPAGPVGLAAGAERRKEQLDFNPDSAITTFNTIGSTNQIATHGDRDVSSFYAEANVPLIANAPFFHSLEARMAIRHERYSDFGNATKPGGSLSWRPIDDSFAFRFSYSEGFRAPNLQELYLGGQESFEDLSNPNAPAQIQVRNLQSGNPNLEPEESRSWNFGFIYSPKQVEGLTLRADYYSVFKENNVGLLEAQFVFDRFLAGDPAFANAVQINPVNNFATLLLTPYSNLGKEISRGYDYGLSYVLPTDNLGRFTFALDGTYLDTYLYTPDKESDYLEGAGDYSNAIGNSLPRHRGRLSTTWNFREVEFTVNWNYIAGLQEYIGSTDTVHEIEAYNTFDLQLAYELPRDVRLAVGVLNVADEAVPFIGGTTSDGYDNGTYDILGRNYYVRLSKRF